MQFSLLSHIMRSMMRKFPSVYAVCALLFFLTLAAVLLIRLNDVRTENIARSEANFAELRALLAQRADEGPIEPDEIRQALARMTVVNANLRAIAVYSFDAGLEYLWVRNRSYLGSRDLPQPALPVTPEFTYDRLNEIVLTDSLRTGAGQTLVAEAVYRTLDSADWILLWRDALTAILAFALLTVLVTLGVIIGNRRSVADNGRLRERPRQPVSPASTASATGPVVAGASTADTAAPGRAGGTAAARDAGGDGLFSAASGVSHETYLPRRLSLELERAASNDQDLALVLCRFPGVTRGGDRYTRCAQLLIEQFQFEDLIFEQGTDGFAVLLVNTSLNATVRQMERFYLYLRDQSLPGKPVFGLTARSGRLIEAEQLIHEAREALLKAQRESQPIIAFRADPQKYRDFVSQQDN